jgi:hypothetical protein
MAVILLIFRRKKSKITDDTHSPTHSLSIAQKRKTGHLMFFGVVTLIDVILSIMFTAAMIAMVMIASNHDAHHVQTQEAYQTHNPTQYHWQQPHATVHKFMEDYNMMTIDSGSVARDQARQSNTALPIGMTHATVQHKGEPVVFRIETADNAAPMDDVAAAELVAIADRFQNEQLPQPEQRKRRFGRHSSSSSSSASASSSSDDNVARNHRANSIRYNRSPVEEEPEQEPRRRLTGFGVFVIVLGFVLSGNRPLYHLFS